MAGGEYVGQTALRVAVLPARVAYLIRSGSGEGLRRAVQEACCRWGGMTEPVIPVGLGGVLDGWWQQVLELAAVDQLVNVDLPPGDAETVASAVGIPLKDLDEYGVGSSTVHPAAVGPAHTTGFNAYVLARRDGSLCDVVGAGDLTDVDFENLQSDELSVRRASDDQVARAQLGEGETLAERTMDQFGEHAARNGPIACPAIVWVTEPDSFKDCVRFWNLRALRPVWLQTLPMLLLPVGQVQYWLGFADRLAYALKRSAQFAPDVAVCSLSVSEQVLHETAAHLGLEPTTEPVVSGIDSLAPLRQPPFTYRTDIDVRAWFMFERSYGRVAEVDVHQFSDITSVRFSSPVTFSGLGFALMRFWGEPFEALPQRSVVADLVQAGASWAQGAIQIRTYAHNDYLAQFHVPGLPETVRALIGDVTASWELSRPGKIGMALLESADTEVLLEPGIFEAITELTTPRSKSVVRELEGIVAEGVSAELIAELAASWGGRAERRYRAQSKLTPALVLERLCEVGWAERGLQITCATCTLTTFVPLAATSQRAECPGCQSPARYEISAGVTVFYRLDSYLDLASDQGVLPHLLAIAALARRHRQSYFLPGTNINLADGQPLEVDIFGVCDGRVLAGEVKTKAADFTLAQIERDVALSRRLGADVHLLAAVDDVPDDVVASARTMCDAAGIGLIVLQREDLRPDP